MGNYLGCHLFVKINLIFALCLYSKGHWLVKFFVKQFIYIWLVLKHSIGHHICFELGYFCLKSMFGLKFLEFHKTMFIFLIFAFSILFIIFSVLIKNHFNTFSSVCPTEEVCVQSLAYERHQLARFIRNQYRSLIFTNFSYSLYYFRSDSIVGSPSIWDSLFCKFLI